MSSFNWKTTSDEVVNALNSQITGKNVIITGASPKSLAADAARAIATKAPNLLVLTGRTLPLLEETKRTILAYSPGANIKLLTFDLGNLAQIREAAASLNVSNDKFDVLINSAGIMAAPYSLTGDGIESQFAINHIGPFLFTNLLLGKLNPDARIVNVSSAAYQLAPTNWEDVNFVNIPYNNWQAYAQSKSANILFSSALARRFGDKGIRSFSVHPGTIYTNIVRHLTQTDLDMLANIPREVKSVEQGAATLLVAAFDPAIQEETGGHLDEDNQIKPIPQSYPYAVGLENEDKLWELSEKLANARF